MNLESRIAPLRLRSGQRALGTSLRSAFERASGSERPGSLTFGGEYYGRLEEFPNLHRHCGVPYGQWH
jgi:hypothetical protein